MGLSHRAMLRTLTAYAPSHARLPLSLCCLALSGCVVAPSPPAAEDLQISDLKQGLMLKDRWDQWTVYEQGSDLTHIDNGSCLVAGHVEERCMWYGIQFHYESRRRQSRLTCVSTFSDPTYIVTPSGRGEIPIRQYTFPMSIDGFSGTFAYPQYAVRSDSTVGGSSSKKTTACSHKGKRCSAFSSR
jgi:hypothetical protein